MAQQLIFCNILRFFWHNYNAFLMSSTAGSTACIPSPASSHSAPSRNPTHRWWWRGGALDHHCVCRSCSTFYCSTSWPLMGGKTPNITTIVAITLQWQHYTHPHNHTTPPTIHTHTITPHTHTTTLHTHTTPWHYTPTQSHYTPTQSHHTPTQSHHTVWILQQKETSGDQKKTSSSYRSHSKHWEHPGGRSWAFSWYN